MNRNTIPGSGGLIDWSGLIGAKFKVVFVRSPNCRNRRMPMGRLSREQRLQAIRGRALSGALVSGPQEDKQKNLESEVARIKDRVNSGDQYAPSPAEEAEAEMPKIFIPTGDVVKTMDNNPQELKRQAAELLSQAKKAEQKQSAETSGSYIDVVNNAYKEFLKRGYEPETARTLTQSYVLLEVGDVLARIANKIG